MTEPVDPASSRSVRPPQAAPPSDKTRFGRRRAMCAGAALLTVGRHNAMAAPAPHLQAAAPPIVEQTFADRPSLIVAGADRGPMAAWGNRLGAVIGGILPPGNPLRLSYVGGPDGVTAANQFEARTSPDGSTGLVVSGAPAIAWLTGDPRAQFDAGHWLPVATGLSSGIVLRGRTPPAPAGASAQWHRLATNGPAEIALAATLGLSLLGIRTRLVPDITDPLAALKSGQVDLIFLHGPLAIGLTQAALRSGAVSLFTLGCTDDAGNLARDPLLDSIPTLPEALALRGVPAPSGLLAAWRAVATAAQLEFALILPWLTPAGTVAWWRKAVMPIGSAQIDDTQNIENAQKVAQSSLKFHTDPTGSFGLATINIDAETSLALKSWILAYNS